MTIKHMDKKWQKTGFWNDFNNEFADNNFYYELYNGKVNLQSLYSLYFSSNISDTDYEYTEDFLKEYTKKNNFKKFLTYLKELLSKGELEMKIYFGNEDDKFSNPKYYSQGNYEDGIEILHKKWGNIKNTEDRTLFENYLVQFTLPGHDYLY